jgi:hypothetical protein
MTTGLFKFKKGDRVLLTEGPMAGETGVVLTCFSNGGPAYTITTDANPARFTVAESALRPAPICQVREGVAAQYKGRCNVPYLTCDTHRFSVARKPHMTEADWQAQRVNFLRRHPKPQA